MKIAFSLRLAPQLRSLALILSLGLGALASAQVHLISGFNFGQFLYGGEPVTNYSGGAFPTVGSIASNFGGSISPGPQDGGVYKFANNVDGTFSAGNSILYFDGTNGSSNFDPFGGGAVGSVTVMELTALDATNGNTVNPTIQMYSGDDNNAGLRFTSSGSANSFSIVTRTINNADYTAGLIDNDPNFSFAAYGFTSAGTVEFFFGSTSLGSFSVAPGSFQAFTMDLPEEFYGIEGATLRGVVSGDLVFDNIQINGLLGGSSSSSLTFWKGGDGLWSAATTPTNWRDAVGGSELGYWDGGEATFGAAAGTVTVDDVDGAVEFSGAKFLVTGYIVGGDALTATAPNTVIQVGDGTEAGAAMSATVNSVITGIGGLNKTDLGTLILTGANTYSGGTTVTAGALQIGAGGTTGSVFGNITNNAEVIFNRSNAATFAGVISGSGEVTQAGSGSTTLTGDNTYTGGTTISAGTLNIGAGGETGSVVGDITNDGALVFNRSNALAYVGVISGTGTVTQTGTGTLTLSGASTHSGATTVSQGTLIVAGDLTGATGALTVNTGASLGIGAGGTTGIVAGNIANGGTVSFDRSDALTYAGVISGAGGLVKKGGETLTLTGENTYTGGTTVNAGTLSIGAGGTAGSVAGNIINDGTVSFSRSDAVTFAGAISGTGAVVKGGSESLALTGTNTYTGGTTVSAGTLSIGAGGTTGSVAGDIANNATVVFNRSNAVTYAGVISGNGTVTKLGTGTATLTGANTYTGGTTVTEGTLQIGAGGATGSVVGNITNNGTVSFNRSDALTYASVISGSGTVSKLGAGTTTFTGPNTYTGATTVGAGALLINGNQSAATGAVTVASTATLGGTGTLGGTVTVQDGGTLAGSTSGRLTMAGLILNPNANLTVGLGAPNPAGPSVFLVSGNLTLDGKVNVNSLPGFGEGVYRLIDYTGSLTDNAMTIGFVPGAASDFEVQTSVANQVNLVFAAQAQNFWSGGSGTWTADPLGTAWKNFTGSTNGAWVTQQAIFQAAGGGTVTVDDTAGAVEFTSIQFAADGYTVTGDALTNNTPAASLRVGDGSADGASTTATIDAVITGTGGVDKTDFGTLILSGNNTYTGGTSISEGTLQIGAGGTSGSVTGNIANDGTLIFNRSDAVTYAGIISGSGAVVKQGTGTTTLTGASTYTGGTTVNAGTLAVAGDLTGATGELIVNTGATLGIGSGGATGAIAGDIANNGTVAFNRNNAATYADIISGSGAVVKQGTGTMTLTGASTYTGGTTVSAGTLTVTGDLTGATGTFTVNTGATLGVGSGGATGAIAGSITNNGTVTFNRSGDLTYGGSISGTGTLLKQGTGSTTLTGASTHTGGTTVSAGTLLVNGSHASDVVVTGGTLGGTGSIGGEVKIQDGARLTGTSGSVLTTGNLTLNSGSVVDVTLAAPSTNRLFQVNGNLTLDGTLNLSTTPQFGEGLYRIFSYTGDLINNTMEVGDAPLSAPNFAIQTTVANQVNLIYARLGMPVWNGTTSTWSLDPAIGGWEASDGSDTGPWSTGMAIFGGSGGTVSIDDTAGPVALSVSGIQFASDGYTIAGDNLNISTANTAFRVGDGTEEGAEMTATISATIAGAGGLDKTDLGTLVLTGTNTHTGGTRVSGGVLEVSSDIALGAASAALKLNGGTLRAGANLTSARSVAVSAGSTLDTGVHDVAFSGVVSGSAALNKTGLGQLTLTGANTHTGATTVSAGTLRIDGSQTAATGAITVGSGGALAGKGTHGGSVTVADGGTLVGATGATLGMGSLTLSPDALIDVTLGAPSTTALFAVKGNLTLDGTLNIATAPQFGEGLYRLFNYTGILTDDELLVGTTPGQLTPDSFKVQTTVAKQINLLFAQAPVVWDDDKDTLTPGELPSLTIFQGGGGDIAVSAADDPVVIKGLQFAASGYSLSGDALTINANNTAFRVGDGTTDGAAIVATVASAITGTGSVDKTDLGTLVLTGTNTHRGGTRVSGGVLEVNSDSALGAQSGTLRMNGGTLRAGANLSSARSVTLSAASTLDTGANNVTLEGDISGTGALTKTGFGTLTVSGNNTNTGVTTISQGAIILAGTGSLGSTAINSGARLSGTGTVRGHLANNGQLSPGASPGTLNVVGNYAQSATGSYAVEIASATSYDKLVVNGTASLGGTLTVSYLNGFVPGITQSFKIVEATGGVTGTFATVVPPSAQVSAMRIFGITYNPFDVTVAYNQRAFAGLTGSENQESVGMAVDGALAAGTTPNLVSALNALPTEAGVIAALGELSPQRYENWYGQAVHSAGAMVRTMETRLAEKKSDPEADQTGGLWFEVVRRNTDFDDAEESAAAEGTSDGIVVGAEMTATSKVHVGVLLGYSDESLQLDTAGSSTRIERFTGAAYVRYEAIRGFIESVAGANYTKYQSQRTVDIPGMAGVAEGSTDGGEIFASMRMGLHLPWGKSRFTPYLAVQHTGWSVSELVESGVDDASLTVDKQKASSLASRVGLMASLPIRGNNLTITPKLDLAWRYEFRDEARTLNARLGEQEFAVQTEAPSASGFIGTLGIDATFGSGTTAYARVTTEQDTAVDKSFDARAGVDFRF